ncbi:MAG: acyl--CoA ligase [Candidatus Hydrogenedentes bacterium]|nr:acyl--CoA ligase [Candidatus Hydrogenedentota bacterium]
MQQPDLGFTWRYVEKWAKQKPDAEALVFGNERITYADFECKMNRTAKAFLAAGVNHGDRVAMLSMARPEFLVTFMAANKVGAMWLGMSPKFSLDEHRYIIGDSQPTVLIAVRQFAGKDLASDLATLKSEYPCIKKLLVIGDVFEEAASYDEETVQERADLDATLEARAAAVNRDDNALLMYTSGSTGKPKGVVHSHASILGNVSVQVQRLMAMKSPLRSLLHFPINHVAADIEIGFGTVYGGGTCVLMDRFDPTATLETVERERITLFGQVPAMFLLEFGTPKFPETDWSSVEAFAWSGSAAPALVLDVLHHISSETGAKMKTGYGSTEMGGFVSYSSPGDDLNTLAHTAGKIAEGFELRIVDDQRVEVPQGRVGEIAVRGPFLMKGYFNRPDLTKEVVDEAGWYYSGDLGWLDENRNLHVTGRKSEMFKSGGENIYPREIEDVIESIPNVLMAAVIGVPHKVYQEVGHAFVMPYPGRTVESETIHEYCTQHLANFKVPKKIEVRPMLPLLPNGKVNKLALREELASMSKDQKGS